jgi:hypothetical protein
LNPDSRILHPASCILDLASRSLEVIMAKTTYKGWPNCFQLSNGLVDLIVTTDVGPRVIRFGFVGEDNEFKEYAAHSGKMGGKEWRLYGGHRLWHAPEDDPRSYVPDNAPVSLEEHKDFIRLVQPTEDRTGIQKEIDIAMSTTQAAVRVTHRLRNQNLWAVELAPWALSVMAPGGKSILPLPPRGSHPKDLSPANTLTMWAFTDMSDPRWTWGNEYIMLRQDSRASKSQKIGLMNKSGWVGFVRNGHLFVKTFAYQAGAVYPDWGCSTETFTNDEMLEVETLGPLVQLQPNAVVEYVENWALFRDVPTPMNDADVNKDVLPKAKAAVAF